MLSGYRTYIMLACGVIVQVLNQLGFADVTGDQLNAAISTLLLIGAWVFHKLHKPKV